MSAPAWFGAVLAGGRSERMGRDKALLAVGGEPLWKRQLGVLRDSGVADPVLVRGPDQEAPAGVRCLRDSHPGIGPMGGLHAALVAAGQSPLVVLAVDMPGIGPDWFAWLGGFCAGGAGAVARHARGCEPLAAIYPLSALPVVNEAIAGRDYSLQRVAHRLAGMGLLKLVDIRPEDTGRLRSLNTTEDVDALESDSPR